MSDAANRDANDLRAYIDAHYRAESRRVFATLVRLLHDFDVAHDALHEAYAAAFDAWSKDGVPERPREWLVSAGRFRAIDAARRSGREAELLRDLAAQRDEIAERNAARAAVEIEDDRLRLIFICCHPAIESGVRVPLTLREVCGLTTEEIASAFLTSKATMAQRIVRGKAKIRDANIPFDVPSLSELPERLDAVLSTIYLVFNEGYSASDGGSLMRVDLAAEAIRLGRVLVELLPDPEAKGLLALMLLHESRRAARTSSDGDVRLLEDQDRGLWNRALIAEGTTLVEDALRSRRYGVYALQAAIAAVHAEAPSVAATDWRQIALLYAMLAHLDPSPVVEVNRAVAIAMRDGPEAGLELLDAVVQRGELADYHYLHSARGELLRRAGRFAEARAAFTRALESVRTEPERRFLAARLASIDAS